jgi:drug/metabolite transporter (DMT)-like permease
LLALRHPAPPHRGSGAFALSGPLTDRGAPPQPAAPLVVGTFALLCLIWGTTWTAIQIGLRGIPPFAGVSLRFAIAAVVMFGAAAAVGLRLGRTRRERTLWVVNGLLSFTVSYGVVYWSEQWVPSSLAAVLFATYPLFVAALAHFALPGESLTRQEIMGIVLGFAGVGVVFSEDLRRLGGPEVTIGAAVMLLSPAASAIGSVAVKRWGQGVHPISLAAVPMALAAGLMGALALALERQRTFVWNATSLAALLYLAVVGSAVTFSLYYWLLAHLPAKRLALMAYVVPIVAVSVGIARGEPFTTRVFGGATLVVLGVALAVQRPPRRRPERDADP